jgi:acetamidase/formamidase
LDEHHLRAGKDTCHWGYFDAALPSVLTIASGDCVTIDTLNGPPSLVPDRSVFHVPPEMDEVHRHLRSEGPHILTGPIHVEGARPGAALEVRIHEIALLQDWGFNLIMPMAGTLPREFERRHVTIPLDAERAVAKLSWGLDLPLAPFLGVMGVAPPPAWGRIGSVQPDLMGGNMDNKELVAGSTLFLPIFNDGALFSCGDGHAVQGDGEVCTTAIETSLRGRLQFFVRDDLELTRPRAETPTHYITMGIDPDLDVCATQALRDMIALIQAQAGLSRPDAYMLCSLAGDLRITQTVNGAKGVHMMLPKALLAA